MLKQLFCLFLLLILSYSSFSQVDTLAFREPSNYGVATLYYQNLHQQNVQSAYYPFQVACYLSLQDKPDSAFVFLWKALEMGAKAEDIITDTDLKPLHSSSQWTIIMDTLKTNFRKECLEVSHPDLALELWLMGIEDQRFRSLGKNYKLKEPPKDDEWHTRSTRMKEIIKNFGWPTYTMVGKKGADAAFYIIQHSPGDIKKYLSTIIKAAKSGEADMKHAAMMIDRNLSLSKGVQIFGTQFKRDGKGNKNSDKIEWSETVFYPIADEENLALRRNKIGMTPFTEHCKKFGVNYIPPSQRSNYKPIRIKKQWIKKGYLLGTEL